MVVNWQKWIEKTRKIEAEINDVGRVATNWRAWCKLIEALWSKEGWPGRRRKQLHKTPQFWKSTEDLFETDHISPCVALLTRKHWLPRFNRYVNLPYLWSLCWHFCNLAANFTSLIICGSLIGDDFYFLSALFHVVFVIHVFCLRIKYMGPKCMYIGF